MIYAPSPEQTCMSEDNHCRAAVLGTSASDSCTMETKLRPVSSTTIGIQYGLDLLLTTPQEHLRGVGIPQQLSVRTKEYAFSERRRPPAVRPTNA
jgi:hypothetical protein